MKEHKILALHEAIVAAVCSIPSTKITGEKEMLNLFPSDLMKYGLGDEIKTEIVDFPREMSACDSYRLAKIVGEAVKKHFPKANVHCVARPSVIDSHWSSVN